MRRGSPVVRSLIDDVERRAARSSTTFDRADVGLRAEAVGDDAAVGDRGDQRLHLGMVDAQHGEAVERHVLDELVEGRRCTASKVP